MEQKRLNRQIVERNFIKASGNAYEAPPETAPAPVVTGGVWKVIGVK